MSPPPRDNPRGLSPAPHTSRLTPCCVIRALLRRDSIAAADWDSALRDFARMTREALDASEVLVAFFDAHENVWSACTSDGRLIDDASIARSGSRALLERVRLERK